MKDEKIIYGHFVFGSMSTEAKDSYPQLTIEMIKYAKKLLEEMGLAKKEPEL